MFLLDTNLVSELRKVRLGRADANVARWADQVDPADLYLSVIVVQELEIGIRLAERRDPAQGAVFRAWMDTQVLPAFSGRIHPWTRRLPCAVLHCTFQIHGPSAKP